jgi:arsenate reductase
MMVGKVYNVLFLCTGNSARSIMAEVLLNSLGRGRFKGYSAGSHPAGQLNPFTIELLGNSGYRVDDLRSKSWNEFAATSAPKMDLVITVCDNAAGEVCPVWPGQPVCAHWSFQDPAAFQGPDGEKRRIFQKISHQIGNRVRLLVGLPIEKLDRLSLKQKVKEIGEIPP